MLGQQKPNVTGAITESDRFFDGLIARNCFTHDRGVVEYVEEGQISNLWNLGRMTEDRAEGVGPKGVPRIYMRREGKRYAVTVGRLIQRIETGIWSDPKEGFVVQSMFGTSLSIRKHNKKELPDG